MPNPVFIYIYIYIYIYEQDFSKITFIGWLRPINETQFLPGCGSVDTAVWMHYLDANKTVGEEARRQLYKNVASNIEQVLAATPHTAPTVRPPTTYHENYTS